MRVIENPNCASFSVKRRRVAAGGRVRRAALADAPSAASAAVAAFATLTQDCATGSTSVTSQNFGRFSNSGSCSYDCGFMEQDWNWWFDFTNWAVNGYLLPGIAAVNAQSDFTSAYAPTATWAATDLPEFGGAFSGSAATITQIDAAIVQAGGNETPAQAQQLAAAFANAANQVGLSLNKANGALQALAAFISVQPQKAGSLPTLLTTTQASADSQIAGWRNNLIGQLACGSGDVTNQYNAAQAVVDGAFATLSAPFTQIDTMFQTALGYASVLPGIYLNVQSDSSDVSRELAQAQGFGPASPLRTLHMNLAKSSWGMLVVEAQSQLIV